ncbi:MAG: hypothetical protein GXP61_01355 [Epsilonproteobacteria bacterium]|nr:hypothetical protein [Campylobacterota bacterium]
MDTAQNVFRKEYRELDAEEKLAMKNIKDLAASMYDELENSSKLSNPRCLALAKTKLEESVMWAIKGITN